MAVSRAANQAEAAAQKAQEDTIRRRAARQATATVKAEPAPEDLAECTVLPMGDGKISTGDHAAGIGEAHYDEGETFIVAMPIAVALYDRGFVNFDGAWEASAKARADRLAAQAELRAIADAARLDAMNA